MIGCGDEREKEEVFIAGLARDLVALSALGWNRALAADARTRGLALHQAISRNAVMRSFSLSLVKSSAGASSKPAGPRNRFQTSHVGLRVGQAVGAEFVIEARAADLE